MSEEVYNRIEFINGLYESGEFSYTPDILEGFKAPDIADVIRGLESDYRVSFFREIDPETAAEAFPILDEGVAREILEEIEPDEIAVLINRMASDNAADAINLLPFEKVHLVLEKVSREDYRDIIALLKFDEESAGGIMAKELLVIQRGTTIGEAIEYVRAEAEMVEHIQKLYVVDKEGVLLGTIPVVALITEEPDKRVDEIMVTDIEKVTVDTDQERVAAIFSKYDLYSIPVVDGRGKLLGRITVDDIIDVIEDEANEDFSRLAGTGDEEFWQKSPLKLSRARMPWLIAGLFGGITAAFVMNEFKASLQSIISLAFFVPVVMAMGGNVGIQSSAIVVRELAAGEFSLSQTGKKVLRELKVALINGSLLGSILFIVATLWLRDYRLGVILGTCLLFVVFWATFIGTSVPLLLNKMNIDPALATGPFITTFNDILGILVYLGVATIFIDWVSGA